MTSRQRRNLDRSIFWSIQTLDELNEALDKHYENIKTKKSVRKEWCKRHVSMDMTFSTHQEIINQFIRTTTNEEFSHLRNAVACRFAYHLGKHVVSLLQKNS